MNSDHWITTRWTVRLANNENQTVVADNLQIDEGLLIFRERLGNDSRIVFAVPRGHWNHVERVRER